MRNARRAEVVTTSRRESSSRTVTTAAVVTVGTVRMIKEKNEIHV